MERLITILLQCSFSMTLITVAYAALLPLFSQRYSAKWRYLIWLVIAIGWIIPWRPQIDLPFLRKQIFVITPAIPFQSIINAKSFMPNTEDVVNTAWTFSLLQGIGVIWIIGVVIIVIYHTLRHRQFTKIVRRWSDPITDLKYIDVLNHSKSELKIKDQIEMKVCQSITSPMLVGYFHPAILLPPAELSEDELLFVLKHELIHFQRHDLWHKLLVLTAKTLHWFNPAVYLLEKSTALQCEISCDAEILHSADSRQRMQYGETIIAVARNEANIQTAFSTNFYGGKRDMKTRIVSIMDTSKKKAGATLLFVVILATLMTGMVFGADSTYSDNAATISGVEQLETATIEPGLVQVLDIPEVSEAELTDFELTEAELTGFELTEPELTEPELTEPELANSELTEAEHVVTYNQDGILITEYIDID